MAFGLRRKYGEVFPKARAQQVRCQRCGDTYDIKELIVDETKWQVNCGNFFCSGSPRQILDAETRKRIRIKK